MAKKLASVMTITSRLITCVSSWAITPSSSAGESSSRMPRVAHTVVDFFERPIAQAFGIGVSITPTRGLGRSACTHSRSMIPCSSGSSAGRHLLDAQRRHRDLVRAEQLQRAAARARRPRSARRPRRRRTARPRRPRRRGRAGTSSAASAPAGRCPCRSSIVCSPSPQIVADVLTGALKCGAVRKHRSTRPP